MPCVKNIFKFFFSFILNKMGSDMIHIPDVFKIRTDLRQHKLLNEVYKGDSNQLNVKKTCNLCNVQVLNLKRHFKSKEHIKIQNELINLRIDTIYCKNAISTTLKTINNMHYLKNMISFKNISVDIMEFKSN